MRTDLQLQLDVINALSLEPVLSNAEIGVAARDGVVTLSGQVATYAEKYAAERVASRVPGVRAVADGVIIHVASPAALSDTEIAHLIVDALRWNTEIPSDRIRVKVDGGWVTLEGDVEWRYQREAAERTARTAAAAFGISNVIAVRPRAISIAAVNAKVMAALGRRAAAGVDSVSVDADDGQITLRGTVSSEAERLEAERAAWSAPGVTNVADLLAIADVRRGAQLRSESAA